MQITTNGRALAMLDDPALMAEQFAQGGITKLEQLEPLKDKLADNISTDEITPGWCCFWYDEKLAEYVYLGYRQGSVKQCQVKDLHPEVIISGNSKGCGSSREHAPYAEKIAGAKIIVAKSFEKIYYQNCINIGLLPTTDFSVLEYVFNDKPIPLEFFTKGMSDIDRAIVEAGGLFKYNLKRLAEQKNEMGSWRPDKPLNIVEKIMYSRVAAQPGQTLKPGDVIFSGVDLRFSHEYVTPMSYQLFKNEFGEGTALNDPNNIVCFQDHLTFLGKVLPKEKAHLLEQAGELVKEQAAFAERYQLKYYGVNPQGGSEAICHNAVVEDLALPGTMVIGTDSHTCTAGAIGALAFGVGATDMANAWYTKDVKFQVPRVINIELTGNKDQWMTAKDVVLYLLSQPLVQEGRTLGAVLVFTGPGSQQMSIDERATIANMAVEAGGMTAIFEPDEKVMDYLVAMRGVCPEQLGDFAALKGDEGAEYDEQLHIDLGSLSPMLSLPGDPRNAHPLDNYLKDRIDTIRINKAYGGSCTGGKREDIDMYAKVVQYAKDKGMTMADGVEFFIQFGSQNVKKYALEQGYVDLFESFGVTLIDPSCGACINAGPGVSHNPDEVTISAQNRNFPGRSGPGRVYLSSPYVVAASAVAGYVTSPSAFFGAQE